MGQLPELPRPQERPRARVRPRRACARARPGRPQDFCKDHWPFFTALGFELVDVEDGYKTDQKGPGIEAALKPDGAILAADDIARVCAGQRDLPPVVGQSNEADAYWRRIGTPLEPPQWREGKENPRLRHARR